ncbi:alpha/beta hydrolase [Alteromonas sp. MTD1]|uniref:alpha/beta fold hydrolase n=1 Tax=Alteromonas sp. MTD1 TaxID=3057962 RepID=UPI0036F3690A
MIETVLSAGDLKLAALDNQVDGPVVIGLHGFLDNAESMKVLAPYFKAYRYIAVDLAGHGRSQHRPLGTHYNQADYIQDLYALLQSEQFSDVILVGHSLGGILASMFASLFPERVRAVVSIDACGPLVEDESTTQQQMRDAIINRFEKGQSQPRPVDLDRAVEARCKISDIPAVAARSILSRNLKEEADGQQFWSSDFRLRTKSILRLTEKQAENLLRAIVCPMLIIGASTSFKNLEANYPKRASWFKNARYEQLVGGHHIHMENTEDVGALISQFVEQL